MIDHKKIEDAIDSYFKNTPTAKIIENLDRLSADREKDLDRENINYKTADNKDSIIGNLVRFEEVSPASQDAAFLAVSIEQLAAPLGLPLYEGYDDLDEMRLTFLTLPSGETVTLMEYIHSPQPGVCICVDTKIQNIPQIVFESCQQLQVSREEAIWFHPDWQEEIDRLYAEHGAIWQSQRYANEKRPELSQLEKLSQQNQYEPIDCFNHALIIYPREYVPATYWAMLQRNLGLAYVNRIQGDRIENLQRSIECFNKSLEIYTQNEFPEKWKINQDDLGESLRFLESFKLLPKQKANSLFSLVTSLFTIEPIDRQFGRKLLAIPNYRSIDSQTTPTSGGLGFILVFLFASLAYAHQTSSLVKTNWWWLILASISTVGPIDRQFGGKLLAIPSDQNSYSQPTPTSGGLGFILVFLFASLAYAYQTGTLVETTWWWLMLTPLVIVGVCDDIWSLPSTGRYLVQIVTATIAVLYFDPFPQPWLDAYGNIGHGIAILLTIIGMATVVNFYNFMDGLDGLVGSVAAVQIAFIAFYTHQPILWLLVAALCGFVYWNWAPAKIFMGEAGSTFLGAIISMSLLNQHQGAVVSWSTFAITMPIIADASYTIIRRLINRENIFRAHRAHLYQRLQQSGLPHSTIAGIYLMMTVAIAILVLNYSYAGAIAGAIGLIGLIAIGEVYLQTIGLKLKSDD